MKTLEMCITQLANMKRLENMTRAPSRSGKKLVTDMEKPPVTKTLELGISQLANTRRLKNISRNH